MIAAVNSSESKTERRITMSDKPISNETYWVQAVNRLLFVLGRCEGQHGDCEICAAIKSNELNIPNLRTDVQAHLQKLDGEVKNGNRKAN